MSRIAELISALPRDAVVSRPLGDIGEFVRGNGLSKSELAAEGVPAIHYGQIHTFYETWATTTKSFVDPKLGVKLRRARPGDLVIATTSEDDAAVGKATAWLGEDDAAVSGDAYIFRHSADPKYIAYFFQSRLFQQQKLPHVTGTKVRRISGVSLAKIRIPLPPIEVQREIASVLDDFTRLQSELALELQSELRARVQQYDHYRSWILSFGSNVPFTPLGEMAQNLDRLRKPVTRAARTPGDIPYYGASGVVDHVSDFILDGDYLLVSEDGANLLARSTAIAFSISGKTWVNNHAHVLQFDTYSERRFVELYLNSIDLSPFVSGAAQPKLNKANLERIPVPDPALADKERIVAILDRLEASTNELRKELLSELADRRLQYASYRDGLLRFEGASA